MSSENPQTLSMDQSLSWEANNSSASHEIPCTESSLHIFTRACHLCISWVGRIQSSLFHPVCARYILISLQIHYIPNPESLQFTSHIHKMFLKHLFLLFFHLPRNRKFPFKHWNQMSYTWHILFLGICHLKELLPLPWQICVSNEETLGLLVIKLLCRPELYSGLSLYLPSESTS